MKDQPFKQLRKPSNAICPEDGVIETLVPSVVPNRKPQERYIPAFSLRFLQTITPARDALPLLLVAMAMMRMKGEQEIALGPAVWAMIGNPGPRVRSRMLKLISALPESLCTLEPRIGRPICFEPVRTGRKVSECK